VDAVVEAAIVGAGAGGGVALGATVDEAASAKVLLDAGGDTLMAFMHGARSVTYCWHEITDTSGRNCRVVDIVQVQINGRRLNYSLRYYYN
jgi:hypothetical protein